jgi:hypothetical protein
MKIKLDVEALDVQSFTTEDTPAARGTVHGHVGTYGCDTVNETCDGANTCEGDTCGYRNYSCAPSCGACGTYECTGEGTGSICEGGSGIGCGSAFC